MNPKKMHPLFKISLLSLTVASSMTYAQDDMEEIVVTGYKGSLQNSANAKRESTALVESVFAEDIGKFADTNIAEAINRMPGIQISRNVFGDGVNVSIRGLGTSFTKVTLNGSQIAVASAGSVDSQNQNREVDLNLFPTELFTRFDVRKTPEANMLEGGASGIVNIRNARPFDNKEDGFNSVVNVSGVYTEINSTMSPKLSAMGSWTNDTFGVLGGVSIYNKHLTTEGYETIGYTNLNTSHAICGTTPDTTATPPQTLATTGGCNPSGGNNWNVAGLVQAAGANQGFGVVPVNAGANLTAGEIIDANWLTSHNPGLNITQISEALLPRLGRPAYMDGDQDRISGLVSFEYRPADNMQFYLDFITADQKNDFNRLDMMFAVRNSAPIPVNMQLDANNVIRSATFANAQYLLEARPYTEDLDFYNVNPGAHFEFGEAHMLDVQLNSSRSDWRRESPTVMVVTPLNQGVTVQYTNNGDVPKIASNFNLNDPNAGWTWNGGRVNIQSEERETKTDGVHIDYRFGDDANNIKFGLAQDNIRREIRGYDNSDAWEDVVCRNGLTIGTDANGAPTFTPVQLNGARAACNGTAPGAAIPQDDIAGYLKPGPYGFIDVDYNAFFAATNYKELVRLAPEANGSNTGARSGIVDEDTDGVYIELNGTGEIAGRSVRVNLGGRYAVTEQLISGPVTIAGVRQYQNLNTKYDVFLPSLNASFDATDDIVLRFSTSRTMTRPNPSGMLPATNFSDPSALNASQGNPNLSPFLSTNIDIGGEWYTGDEGYVGLTLFGKQMTGFTVTGTTTLPFLSLGIPFDSLSPTQQTAMNNRGGPDIATVLVSQQVNAPGNLEIEGAELTWVQPLDMVLEGLGINANYTKIHQRGEGQGAPAQAVGVAPETYNLTAYWENFGASLRLTYTWADKMLISGPNQNGIPYAQLRADSRGQLDLSASYEFEDVTGEPQISLNIANLTGEPFRSTFQYDSATFTYYDPGMIVTLGVRASF